MSYWFSSFVSPYRAPTSSLDSRDLCGYCSGLFCATLRICEQQVRSYSVVRKLLRQCHSTLSQSRVQRKGYGWHHLSADASRYLTVGIWLVAAIGAVRRWRSGRPTIALVLLAYSPGLIFFAGAYGNEGLLRVYLFSLPWSACLVASAIQPVAAGISVTRGPPSLDSCPGFSHVQSTDLFGSGDSVVLCGLLRRRFFVFHVDRPG